MNDVYPDLPSLCPLDAILKDIPRGVVRTLVERIGSVRVKIPFVSLVVEDRSVYKVVESCRYGVLGGPSSMESGPWWKE